MAGGALALGLALSSAGDELKGQLIGAEAGIREVNHTYRASPGDINGDGHEDLIVIPHYDAFPRIYVNRGDGTFEDVAEDRFPPDLVAPRDRHHCSIGDVNGSGRADIYCSTGGSDGGSAPNASELWIQQEDGSFEPSSEIDDFDLGPGDDRYGRTRDAVFLDANGDGHLDLYTQNAYPRQDGRSPDSRLFINEDGERYVNGARHGFTDANLPIGGTNLQVIDYDDDGWEDIVACGKDGVFLLRNFEGEDLRDVADGPEGRMPCTWAEVANVDGSDRGALVRLEGAMLAVHPLDEEGGFGPAIYSRGLAHGQSFATGDATGDGLDDIYVIRRGEEDPTGLPTGPSGEVADDRPDAMLINKGDGTEFEETPIPQIKEGRGDTVTAIDADGDGRDAFVVLNGHRKSRGPVELLAFSGEE